MNQAKHLIALDLDSTITDIDCNYELLIKLLNNKEKEDKILEMNKKENYIKVFNIFYEELRKVNYTIDQLKEELKKIKLAPGMVELFNYLKENKDKYYVILITGDNNFIIENVLKNNNIYEIFDGIYCNKSQIDKEKGKVLVNYNKKHFCTICNPSQCKFEQLELFLNKVGNENIIDISWIADGGNDLCIVNKLGEKDYTFPRKDYNLYKKLFDEGIKDWVMCKLEPWENANTILNILKQNLIEKKEITNQENSNNQEISTNNLTNSS